VKTGRDILDRRVSCPGSCRWGISPSGNYFPSGKTTRDSFQSGQEHPGIFRKLILSPKRNCFHRGSRIGIRRPPFQEDSMIGISSGGVFRLSGNCFRSSPKFLWKVNRSWNFGEESVSSKSGVLNGIASDQASRYFRYRLPSEGISEEESLSGWESQKN